MNRAISLIVSFAVSVTAFPVTEVSAEETDSTLWDSFLKYDLCINDYDNLNDDEKELCRYIFDTEQAAGDNIVCERARRTLAGDDVGERITLDQLEDAYGSWDSLSFYNTFSGWQTFIDCVPDVICLNYVKDADSYVYYNNMEYWLDDERSSYVIFREKVSPDTQNRFEVYDGNDKLIKTITTKFDCPMKDFRGDTVYMKEFGMTEKNGGWYYTKPDGTAVLAWSDHSLSSSSKKITEPFVIESEINGCPVTTIEHGALACAPVTEIILPDTVEFVDYNAFMGCQYLEKVNFPKGLKHIGKKAFYGCDSLTELTLDCPELVLGEDVFYESQGLKTAYINVKDIGEKAFSFCKSLENVTLGNSIKNIRYQAFKGDVLLTEMYLPDSVRTIGQEALDNLTSVTIPSSVEVIGSYPHKTMQELTSGIMPPQPLRPLTDEPKCAFGEDCIIYGHTGTEAERYAEEWGLGFVPSVQNIANPMISYLPGNSCVKLTWAEVNGAEKYAVCGYVNNKWHKLAEGVGTSYIVKKLKADTNYKVAVIAKVNGKWNRDVSNAIIVTPKKVAVSKYPIVTSEVSGVQFKLKWTPVANAEKYCIAVYQDDTWKAQAYINGNLTSFTSPKISKGTYTMVVCAKLNGTWDTSNIDDLAFKITIE